MDEVFLHLEEVQKTYFDKKGVSREALKGLSLEIYRGEALALLGVNGAGKTTLISILAALHPPSAGEIMWKGESIFNQLLDYRAVVGLCPQYSTMEPQLSMEENLVFSGLFYGLSKQEALSRKESLLDQFGLKQYSQSYLSQLSGGYRQRFLIARALMHHPKILFLDEPTVGLDSHIRRELWEVINALKEKKITILLTTHYLDEAESLCDRICLIHQGSLCTVDTPDNLKKKHKKNSLEEVFLKFVDDPDSEVFNA